jgi:hypothetical protein
VCLRAHSLTPANQNDVKAAAGKTVDQALLEELVRLREENERLRRHY